MSAHTDSKPPDPGGGPSDVPSHGARSTSSRRRAYRWGLSAEVLALATLLLRGWWPIGRRVRLAATEIDLIVLRGNTIALVEVKARRTTDAALSAVSPTHARRMAAAGRQWLALNPRYADRTIRLDVIAVIPWRLPIHLPNAFPAD